jgi:hypothetical protein
MFDISVVIPGIRPNNWPKIYEDLRSTFTDYKFELICIGPNFPSDYFSDKLNFRFVRDFGHPSRCMQLGATLSSGKYICWIPDDIILEVGALQECLDLIKRKPKEDGMTLRYSEGVGFTGNEDHDLGNDEYWIGFTHADQSALGIPPFWKIAPLFLYDRDTYFEFGGLDCRFEHINFNTHDLAYRMQTCGSTIHLSPRKVLSADWTPNDPVVSSAHGQHDYPLMKEIYSKGGANNKLNKNNWDSENPYWHRREYKL